MKEREFNATAFVFLIFFIDFHGTVESTIESVLRSYRIVIEQNRQLNEGYQNCAELIRTSSAVIVTLEKEIQKLKDEKSLIGSKASSKPSPLSSLSTFFFWAIFVSHALIPLIRK